MDREQRVNEMTADGVSAEVLYPTHGLRTLSLDDPELEQACVRVYNDWIADYCSAAPERLVGLAMLSMYDVEAAVREMERSAAARPPRLDHLAGATARACPSPPDHYERYWAAAQDMGMPVNLHILSGHGYSKRPLVRRRATL
jgi:predicted TIM-barrel fold metal-dependent hydrolase